MKLTPKHKEILETYEIENPVDFLTHYPSRYEFFEKKPIETWKVGDVVIFEGQLASSFRVSRYRPRQSVTSFQVMTETEELVKVSIFNNPYLRSNLFQEGITVLGTVDDRGNVLAKQVSNKASSTFEGIQPVYSLKSGIKNFKVKELIGRILDQSDISEVLPVRFIQEYKLMTRSQALNTVHRPQSKEQLELALKTLKYTEFLQYHLQNALNSSVHIIGKSKEIQTSKMEAYLKLLPFTLTEDQKTALQEICEDLQLETAMNRILQGDVGSGKTVVALLSAIVAYETGYQVAFMAPTEVLVKQHIQTLTQIFPHTPFQVLTGSLSESEKNEVLEEIREGKPSIVFGTHALFQDNVIIPNLGYVIIDEQHRFGVDQRQKLIDKGVGVDVLMLSATPIPRTLANALFFDLKVSSIRHYPAQRQQTITKVVPENSLRSLVDAMHEMLQTGQQIYIVCPSIEMSELPGVRDVDAIYEQMVQLFSEYQVGKLHGAMKADEKDTIMDFFKANQIQILVCTTVIEVGIDVPNANMMIIYNAEMFGLSTLHQLRGRVGRKDKQGFCYLLSKHDKERLILLESSSDGFELSMHDLRMRGMGDVLGTRQSGIPSFILGDIEKDQLLLEQAKKDAYTIVDHYEDQEYQTIIASVKKEAI